MAALAVQAPEQEPVDAPHEADEPARGPLVCGVGIAAYRFGDDGEAHPAPVVVEGLDGADPLADLAETLAALLETGRDVIAVHPAWDDDHRLRQLQTVRAGLGSPRLSLVGCALPPLASAVMVALCAALAPRATSTGALVAAMPEIETRLLVLGRLSRLTGLRQPAPTEIQRLLSLLPWTRYGVTSWPEPAVVALGSSGGHVALPEVGEAWVVAEAGVGGRQWVDDTMLDALGGPRHVTVEAPQETQRWWGCSDVVEVVVHPSDVGPLVDLVDEQLSARCPWCRRTTATVRCHACGRAIAALYATRNLPPAGSATASTEGPA